MHLAQDRKIWRVLVKTVMSRRVSQVLGDFLTLSDELLASQEGLCSVHFFFCGEGPRSRCYGHTAALRLIVQPCDEDER